MHHVSGRSSRGRENPVGPPVSHFITTMSLHSYCLCAAAAAAFEIVGANSRTRGVGKKRNDAGAGAGAIASWPVQIAAGL